MLRRGLRRALCAAALVLAITPAPAGEPLTRDLLISALNLFGIRAGALVPIGTGRYRIERLAIEQREAGRFVIDVTTRGE